MAPRIFPTDEELGKRDDDHVPGHKAASAWRNLPYAYRRRRLGVIAGAVFCVWLLLHVFWAGSDGVDSYTPSSPGRPRKPKGPPSRAGDDFDEAASQHYYNGHIKFFELGSSLHAIGATNGAREKNRNVLFAASSLKSVSALVPLACEMAKWNRNHVHFAIVGRYDIGLDDILEVNGVDREGCNVYWHDGRPDYVQYSSDIRAEAIVMAAMGHIQSYMHPQVVITDDFTREDQFFSRGMRRKTKEQRLPVIEVPKGRADGLEWLTRLDSGSLRSWHKPSIDILIHAPEKSSGSLLRLLKSIQDADYAGLVPPRITVELPADIDPPTQWFLEHMVWPPAPASPLLSPHHNSLILRHRVSVQRASSEELSVRFLESFYPSADSHVLLLSPSAQLSPLYYQYLMFHLLEYKYNAFAGEDNDKLFGLSLEIPSYYLNGTTEFEPPTTETMRDEKYKKGHPDATVPFTWEAPNSNAALYFGDKWVEIHSFLTNRLAAFRAQENPVPRPRTVHESLPSWLEYFLELMRARGYALHYPGLDSGHQLVTVHNELYQPPEDMLAAMENDGEEDKPADLAAPDDSKSPFLSGDVSAALTPPVLAEHALDLVPLHQILPFDADPPEIRALPLLSHTGVPLEPDEARDLAQDVTRKFRENIGGCRQSEPEGKRRKVKSGSARDLFCFGDEGDEVFEAVKPAKPPADDEDEEGGGEKKRDDDKSNKAVKASKKTYMGEPLEKPEDDADDGDGGAGEKGKKADAEGSKADEETKEKGL